MWPFWRLRRGALQRRLKRVAAKPQSQGILSLMLGCSWCYSILLSVFQVPWRYRHPDCRPLMEIVACGGHYFNKTAACIAGWPKKILWLANECAFVPICWGLFWQPERPAIACIHQILEQLPADSSYQGAMHCWHLSNERRAFCHQSNSNIYQRKFRNLTSDYTESCCWRSVNQEMWSRRCDTAEMCDIRIWRVGSARNAVFFHSFVASPARKVRS